jgi:hypothetical protein
VSDRARHAGVLLRVDGVLRFVPASIALRVASHPRVTPVPGAPADLLGIALHDGMVVPVVAIGTARREMVVCQYGGDLLGLVGGEVVRTGSFDAFFGLEDVVEHEGQPAHGLDVAAVYARVQSTRPARWGS